MLTPVQSQRYARLVNNLTEEQFYAYYDHLSAGGRVEDFFEKMEKHGSHDQKTHGNWASGEVVLDINEWNKAELAKYDSPSSHEMAMLEKMMSQRITGIDVSKFKQAVDVYQTAHGYTINEALRDPQISEDGVQLWIDGMDSAIKAVPATITPMTVYRGIKGNGLDFFESLNAGDVFTDKGFFSTTLDTNIATKFSVAGSMYQGIVMRLNLPIGTKGLFTSSVTGLQAPSSREAEFVLPRNSSFKVLNNQGKVWDVEVVNNA